LPHYETIDVVFRDPYDNSRIISPNLMWERLLILFLKGSQNQVWIFGTLMLFLVVGGNMVVFVGTKGVP
jgi:hypothetical protein